MSWNTSCVTLRPTRSPAQRRSAHIVDGLCTPNVSSRFDSLEIRVLLVADVGQLDDNLSVNLVVPHHGTVHDSPPAVPLLVVR